eukprot:jgi/Pico_ML_1/56030/g1628.t1
MAARGLLSEFWERGKALAQFACVVHLFHEHVLEITMLSHIMAKIQILQFLYLACIPASSSYEAIISGNAKASETLDVTFSSSKESLGS